MTGAATLIAVPLAEAMGLAALVMSVFLAQFALAALSEASRGAIQRLADKGDHRALRLVPHLERRARAAEALRILRNLSILAIGAALLALSGGGIGSVGEAVLALVTIALAALLGRAGQALGEAAPDRFVLPLWPVVSLSVIAFGWVAALLDWPARKALSALGLETELEEPVQTAAEELRDTLDTLHREGSVVKAERDRLGGLLDLGELEVSDIMVHRTRMRALNADDPPDVSIRAVLDSPYTRLPVWRGTLDNIVGVLHARDLLTALAAPDADPATIDVVKLAQKPWFVPETTRLSDQLNAFLRRKSHFAVVVDEYGEVEGIVTLEDIMEEIVGDIADEHDVEIQGVRTEADGSVVVDGSVPIRDLNRALDWDLPDEEATTIAGLVIHESRIIPNERQAFTFHAKRFIVMKRVKNRITKLRIRPLDGPAAAGE